ncbi:MAG: hypothetical protein GY941_30265 [Planctomycetes bacterium]|nr:hypothetical protein [Planctomycetota bacterium]
MNRIKTKDLDNLVNRINDITGHERKPYASGPKFKPNPGVYHLDWAYGGVCLVQMMEKGSGVRSVLPGFGTKRELYDKLQSFLVGLERSQEVTKPCH